MKIIYTTDPLKRRIIRAGYIKDRTFHKDVVKSRHLLRIAGAYAIQADVYEELKNEVDSVIIHEKDTGDTYSAPISYWETMGRWWEHNHGKQRILAVKYMQNIKLKK